LLVLVAVAVDLHLLQEHKALVAVVLETVVLERLVDVSITLVEVMEVMLMDMAEVEAVPLVEITMRLVGQLVTTVTGNARVATEEMV
jgi:hypothetical protein